MANEIYRRPAGTGLTPQEMVMLEEAEKYPLEYDEDSPKLTSEQLDQFRPVHYATMEERTQALRQTVSDKLENAAVSATEFA